MKKTFRRLVLLLVWAALCAESHAAEVRAEIGRFGEIPNWLILKVSDIPMDQDPLAPMGGELKYAAMEDLKWVPNFGAPLEIPDGKGGKTRIGNGVWEATRMVMPDMPGIWNEYLRLVIPEGYIYAYCRLDSPTDRKASLITGLRRNGGKCRLFLNGKELGAIDGGFGFENGYELPIALKKGANHLFLRFFLGTEFACRLVGEGAEPMKDVKNAVPVPNPAAIKTPEPGPVPENQKLANLAKAIPAFLPPENPHALGMRLARTVALLESGKHTHRPVRIMFSGQSIEAGWTAMFIQNLRDRYPDTTIIAENRAIGGVAVPWMYVLMKHDIFRWQPDLVLFSAYHGTSEVWERLLCELRSETTADIIIRTQHVGGSEKLEDPDENAESLSLRRLAQKYDVEFIEVRKEWRAYLKDNNMQIRDLLRDGIHLNEKGDTFMALLYDRHIKYNPAAEGWGNRVRRFDVGRFLTEKKNDEIVLEGKGWTSPGGRVAMSNSAEDRLKLKFNGNRIDLIFSGGHGKCAVLIDGKKPSEWNLFHGTKPDWRTKADRESSPRLDGPWHYFTGKNMQEETWVMTITEAKEDADPKQNIACYKFTLKGSKTGFDGEGRSDRTFVSNSGRITVPPKAAAPKDGDPEVVFKPLEKPRQVVWHILPDFLETVPEGRVWPGNYDYYYGQQVHYVTVADGLPCGEHELTLIPIPAANPKEAFSISAIDIHRPPFARDARDWTTQP